MTRAFLVLLIVLGLAAACVTPQDNPTNLHDLRVLAVRLEPPEVLIPGCSASLIAGAAAGAADGGEVQVPPELQQLLFQYAATPISYSALIYDTDGGTRRLRYRLSTCNSRTDRTCTDGGMNIDLKTGTTHGGVYSTTIVPGAQIFDDGTPLLFEVILADTYKGLGGVRVPLNLELVSEDTGEHLFVQKLMVYTCQFFPQMTQNVTPVMPGVTWNGEAWAEDEVKQWQGRDEVTLLPDDFSAFEEAYTVPSLFLQPINLVETWKVTWMTTGGTMSSFETGGTDLGGTSERHKNKWKPPQNDDLERDIDFYFVVRDGRGGQSWLTRHAHWKP